MRANNTTNWLNKIKEYGRQLDDFIDVFPENASSFDLNYSIGTFGGNCNRIEYSVDTDLLKTQMGKLVIDVQKSSIINSLIQKNRVLHYRIDITNGAGLVYASCSYGYFIITDIEEQKDKKSILITCYDPMVKTMTDYYTPKHYVVTEDTEFDLDKTYYQRNGANYNVYTGATTGNPHNLGLYEYVKISFPISLKDYAYEIAKEFGFGISYDTFDNENAQVTSEHYVDSNGASLGYTFRDVLDDICEALGCRMKFIISNDTDKRILLEKNITDTSTTINEDYFKDKNVNVGKKIGPYNVVVLSRASDSDNIYYPATLPQNPVEFKINDNPILEQDNRDTFIQGIYNEINGLEFYTNEFVTNGLCLYEAGDKFSVSIDGTSYPCILLHDQMIRTTGLKENIHTDEPKESVSDYKYASTSDKVAITSKNAKILVDKANASITQIVEAVGEDGEVTSASIISSINNDTSQVQIDADKVDIEATDVLNILAGNEINLTSKNISINSNNFSVDTNGNMSCNNANITGGYLELTDNPDTYDDRLIIKKANSTELTTATSEYVLVKKTMNDDYNYADIDLRSGFHHVQGDSNEFYSSWMRQNLITLTHHNNNVTHRTQIGVDSSSFYGDVTINGKLIIPKSSSQGIYNTDDYRIISDYGNGSVVVNATGDVLFLGFSDTNSLNFLNGASNMDSDGNLKVASIVSKPYRISSPNVDHQYPFNRASMRLDQASSEMNNSGYKPAGDGFIQTFFWDTSSGSYDTQLYIPNQPSNNIQIRFRNNASSWANNWKNIPILSSLSQSDFINSVGTGVTIKQFNVGLVGNFISGTIQIQCTNDISTTDVSVFSIKNWLPPSAFISYCGLHSSQWGQSEIGYVYIGRGTWTIHNNTGKTGLKWATISFSYLAS